MRWLALGISLMVGACGTPPQVLQMKQFHLREISVSENEDELVRGEKLKRLYGAVSEEEREKRLGHYYSVRWRGPEGTENQSVRVVFEYRQAVTGSEIKRLQQDFPSGQAGSCEFVINGASYEQGGRVLAWRLLLYRGDTLVATKRSYLWE